VIYREYTPAPAVEEFLICSWTLEAGRDGPLHQQRVLPDGCTDIVWIGDASPIAVGPMTRSVLAIIEPGTTLVGLRFRPEVASRVLGIPAHELTDQELPLAELWRRQAVDDTSDRLREERLPQNRVAIAQSLIASRSDAMGGPDALVQDAVSRLTSGRSDRIESLARNIGISERQLHRRFAASVGYSPKTFQRIARFQTLLALAEANTRGLREVSLAAGYADQAHMTREVVEFAGVTPGALLGKVASALVGSAQADQAGR
jgi:transcriptional regulator GlxA family with amidase domain